MINKQLTNKQEAFVQAYLRTGNAYQSYLEAYNVSPTTARSTTEANASRTLNNSKVIARLQELRGQLQEASIEHMLDRADEAEETVSSVTAMLRKAYAKAEAADNGAAAMTSAALGIAKVQGLIINKSEDVTPSRSTSAVDARIRAILTGSEEAGTPGAVRGKSGSGAEGKAIPTVPGHGTA